MSIGITYALWDRVDKEFVSWNWLSFKTARAEVLGYVNHKALAILRVQNKTVMYEVNREVGKRSSNQTVHLALAQSKLY